MLAAFLAGDGMSEMYHATQIFFFFFSQLKGASGKEAIKNAIDAGYKLFDTAFLYDNEEVVGAAINEKCVEGTINREEINIISKLWGIHHDQVEKVKSNPLPAEMKLCH
jgi:diketogulonate reductase-like aldo/keto reductase